MIYLALFPLFVLAMLLYFKIAMHFNIIDKPNVRSSHVKPTIRGGGIIYLIAAISLFVLNSTLWLPVLGLWIIGIISFIDDRITISSRIRILMHLLAVTCLFSALQVFQLMPWYIIITGYVFVIGIINAYNFMDGINGITGLYSLTILIGLAYINIFKIPFIAPDAIYLPILATVVFLFFNFRVKAKCFAGDVGSVSLAFWIVWLLLSLMLRTNNYIYILFLAVYGVDSILTIIHRLILKQNIFLAHRLHFYQILVNELQIPHLYVSVMYALLQFAIILFVLFVNWSWPLIVIISLLPLMLVYILIKPKLINHRTNRR